MSWTTPADLHAQVQRMWESGLLLTSLVSGEDLFPRRVPFKRPTSNEMAERFEDVRTWIAELRQGAHYRVVMRELRHRIIGSNVVPAEIWIDTLDNALNLIGKARDARRFKGLVELVRRRNPELLRWFAKRPIKALDLAEDWPRFLDIISWMQAHPRPGVYMRQMDIPGVHTKFIEEHRAVLSELLDLSLPPDAIDSETTGVSQFCRRYGFLDRPLHVRFRILDPELVLLNTPTDQDIAVNQETFNRLDLEISRVFITENEINYLALPSVLGGMVIFGAGYGFEVLAQATWLHRCLIYYWGDIDTHGFAILDQLRSYFPKAESFLMDRKTLMAHEQQWVREPQPLRRDLTRLTKEERALFADLRDNRILPTLRLEQERIGFGWIMTAVKSLVEL
ncbi:MAG: DUF2220 family protein [Nitrospiraceae bacterium]|nr:DUF2220 family protein [Nitrospiraceae bacterium]